MGAVAHSSRSPQHCIPCWDPRGVVHGQAPCRAAPRQSGGWQGFAHSAPSLTQPATSNRHAVLAQLNGDGGGKGATAGRGTMYSAQRVCWVGFVLSWGAQLCRLVRARWESVYLQRERSRKHCDFHQNHRGLPDQAASGSPFCTRSCLSTARKLTRIGGDGEDSSTILCYRSGLAFSARRIPCPLPPAEHS